MEKYSSLNKVLANAGVKNIRNFWTKIVNIYLPFFRPKSLKHHIRVQEKRFCSASEETEQSEAAQSSHNNLINQKFNSMILQWVKPETKVLPPNTSLWFSHFLFSL